MLLKPLIVVFETSRNRFFLGVLRVLRWNAKTRKCLKRKAICLVQNSRPFAGYCGARNINFNQLFGLVPLYPMHIRRCGSMCFMITVIQNAYLRFAERHPNFSETHKKIMLVLMHEKKHYTLEELLCFANYCEDGLNSAINDLESAGLVRKEGWLVSLADQSALEQKIFAFPQTLKVAASRTSAPLRKRKFSSFRAR
jgi:hypothetical protein